MEALEAIKARTSANHFDSAARMSEAEIKELVSYALEAPSSYNIQHWRFIAVTNPEDKARLKAVAYNQPKIGAAAVTFIVLGDLRGYEKLPLILERTAAAGLVSEEGKQGWLKAATGLYLNHEQMARDEAIRGASLAAMTLMVAATAKGLASGPMIGFDPAGVKREFNIPDRYVPVMLLAVGPPAPGNWGRKPRLTVDEVLAFGEGREF